MPEDRDSTTARPARTARLARPADADGSDGAAEHVTSDADGLGAVAAVPAPGHAGSSAGPGVRVAQGASPADGVHAGEKSPDSDASISSPGAWTALAAPGKPDGEVDTRT